MCKAIVTALILASAGVVAGLDGIPCAGDRAAFAYGEPTCVVYPDRGAKEEKAQEDNQSLQTLSKTDVREPAKVQTGKGDRS